MKRLFSDYASLSETLITIPRKHDLKNRQEVNTAQRSRNILQVQALLEC